MTYNSYRLKALLSIDQVNVVPFRLSPEAARREIQGLCNDKSKIVVPEVPIQGSMAACLNDIQIYRCLQEGEMTRSPVKNDSGDFECTFKRVGAGRMLYVTVALTNCEFGDQKSKEKRLFVVNVAHDGFE